MNIYKIAEIAGVSVTTVSRVINGKEGVGEETKRKILDIVKQNNFQPRISKNSLDNVAFFLRADGPNAISSPFVSKIIDGAANVFLEHGFDIMIIPFEKIPKERNEFKVYCHKKRIAGGIFINLRTMDSYVNQLGETIPLVTVCSKFNNEQLISVRARNYEGAYEAVKYLIDMGHRKILMFMPDLDIQDHSDRRSGYKQAHTDAGIPCDPDYIIDYLNYSETGLYMVVENMMTSNEKRPTAAFVCDDKEVIRISSIMKRIGIMIPDDLSVVGFDDYEYSEHFSPPLTTVRQPIYEMGQKAAQAIVNQLSEFGQEKVSDIILDTKLIIRKSVMPLNK